MSVKSDSNEFDDNAHAGDHSDSDFEYELKQLSPKPIPLDLSSIDRLVSSDLDASTRHGESVERAKLDRRAKPQWRLATASWLVGLATGILVAFFSGSVLREPTSATDASVHESNVPRTIHDDPQTKIAQSASPANEATAEPTASTAPVPASRSGLSRQTDYIAEFSPANVDSAERMSIATRDLLIGFPIGDLNFTSMLEAETTRVRSSQTTQPVSLGQMRKELRVAL